MGRKKFHLSYFSAFLLATVLGVVYFGGLTPGMAQDDRVSIEPRISTNPSSGSAERMASIRTNVDLVLIPVTVTDKHDRLITGLEKGFFKLYDDKVEQVITHFGAEDAPVSIVLAFDSSGSMGPKLQKSRAAVAAFLKGANPEDEFALVPFNDRAQVISGFTDQIEEIQNKLLYVQSKGRTALLDAMYLSLNEMKNAKHQRKAILVISDGGDNNSRYTFREVKNRVREADVQIYSIGILEPMAGRMRSPEEFSGPALLDDLAHESGGRLFEVDDLNELSDIAAKVGTALRHQYMLGYSPSVEKHDGKYHSVQVKVARPKGLPPLRTSFRTGYYAR